MPEREHATTTRAMPDIRGLVFYAQCTCGWRGANHPSIPTTAEASQRATEDAESHLAQATNGAS